MAYVRVKVGGRRRGRSYKRTRSRSRSRPRRTLTKKIKKVALGLVETKHRGECLSRVCTTDNTLWPSTTVDLFPIALCDIDAYPIAGGADLQANTRYGQEYLYLGTKIDLFLAPCNNFSNTTTAVTSGLISKQIYVRVLICSNRRNIRASQAPLATDRIWCDHNDDDVDLDPTSNQIASSMSQKLDKKKYNTHYDKIFPLAGWGPGAAKHISFFFKPGKNGPCKIKCDQDLTGNGNQDKRFWIFWVAYDPEITGSGIGGGAVVPVKQYKTALTWHTLFKDP